MDTDIRDLHTGSLTIQKPKKHQESLFGKIVSGEDNNVSLFFYNVRIVKHKRVSHHDGAYTVLYLKVSKDILRKVIEFDDFCKEHVRMNATRWFSKSLDENVIDEYYMSSIVMSPTDGCLVKLKLKNAEDLLKIMRYDVLLAIRGLRFYKQRFVAEWEMSSVKLLENDFVGSYAEDSGDEEDQFSCDGIDVATEDLDAVAKDLLLRIAAEMRLLENKIKPMDVKLQSFDALYKQLSDPRVLKTVTMLDNIAEELE
jgi:hypothetical protein